MIKLLQQCNYAAIVFTNMIVFFGLDKVTIIIIIIIKNECHSNIIVDRLQGCGMCTSTITRTILSTYKYYGPK